MKSPALIEDLELPLGQNGEKEWSKDSMNAAYNAAGTNCIMTAVVYVLTLVFSVWQIYENNKKSGMGQNMSRVAPGRPGWTRAHFERKRSKPGRVPDQPWA